MKEVSLVRLYVLRAMYLLIFVGLTLMIGPQLLHHPTPWPMWHGVGCCLLAAVGLLAFIGIKYPLKMLPVLFFEIIWKAIWLLNVALPLWQSGQMDADNLETAQNCIMGIIVPLAIPWRYVWAQYIAAKGDRWR